MTLRRWFLFLFLSALYLGACTTLPEIETPTTVSIPITLTSTPTIVPTEPITPTATPVPLVPDFKHIIIVVFENKEFGTVVNNPQMPYFNQLAQSYTLLTQLYAETHPSLPNYLAMIAGDTFGVTFDCTKCFQDAVTLPDLIESHGLTWKTYQEDMPSPCYPDAEAGTMP
jgi:hypothetical protein